MTICSKFCDGCDYLSRNSSGKNGVRRTCDYILITGSRRGCPAGAKCTKKRVGGVVIPPMARDIAEDVRAAGARSHSGAAKAMWNRIHADPALQIKMILRWDTLDDTGLRKVISDMRRWQKKKEAAHGTET